MAPDGTQPHAPRRAVFLDRDGTINMEVHYLHRAADFVLIPGAAPAIRALNQAGYLVIVVTNQAGIARGYYDEAAVNVLHAHLQEVLQAQQARIDAFYLCPHHPDFTGVCTCRKPQPGMLLRAAAEWNIDLAGSWLIGDTESDIAAGTAAGCCTILVRTGYGTQAEAHRRHAAVVHPSTIVDDIGAAVRYVLNVDRQNN